MVLAFENIRVLSCSDLCSPLLLVRNRTYHVRWDYSAWDIIFENAFIGEGKLPYAY